LFNQCWFVEEKTFRGVNALKSYHKEWDEKNKVFRNQPKHDWASHGADGFRTFAVGFKQAVVIRNNLDPGGVKPLIAGLLS
jgi:hypothetical protein